MDLERPQFKLERCDGIFCELSPEDKVRWIAATKEGREAIEKEHCAKNGLHWGIDDGEFVVPPPPAFGAERILSENNLNYSETHWSAPLIAPLITDWSSARKMERIGEDWFRRPDGKWEKKTRAKFEPLGVKWFRRPDGKWED